MTKDMIYDVEKEEFVTPPKGYLDYLERERRKKKIPYDREEVIDKLTETVKWIEEVCDGRGDVDWALANIQIYFHRLERILSADGSL